MWKNIVERGRRMRIGCWMPKATNTHSGCVILIAFPLQQWLNECPQCYFKRTLPALMLLTYLVESETLVDRLPPVVF
jgi:hypothetical protein